MMPDLISGVRTIVLACALTLGLGQAASAQVSLDSVLGTPADPAAEEGTAPEVAQEAEPDPEALDAAQQALSDAVPDLSDWQGRVRAAEALLESSTQSSLALSRTRDSLFTWRDRFQALGSMNSGRIATVQARIDALGTPAEGVTEQPAIAARRDELNQILNDLRAPVILARESYARANGLIAEIDSQLRAKKATRLTARGASPLNPENWGEAILTAQSALAGEATSASTRLRRNLSAGNLLDTLPLAIVYLALASILLMRSRTWVALLQSRVENSEARGRAIWSFLLSLWTIVLPTVGLAALIFGLRQLGVLGQSGDTVSEAIFGAGFLIIVALWLNQQLFPMGERGGPLGYPAEVRARIRRNGVALGIGLAALAIADSMMAGIGASDASTAVIVLPLQIILALVLFRLGYLLRHAPMEGQGRDGSRGRVRITVGLICMIVAVVTPLLSAAGYSAASEALFGPAVITLAIFGIIIVLQRLVYDIYAPALDAGDAGPLMPVVIGFVLFVLAVPVLALVWGAQVTDLLEVWAQFRAGFQIGETTISPTDFMTFVLIFAGGYLFTQFIKRQLKSSVLPRTRMDLGGQNAVAAGVGYIGILVAALIAITTAGIDLSSLAIVAGALSVGIGFGLQTIVQNFVSGIILLIERPIGEGDMIEVNGQVGFVRDISVRSTRIETFDRTDVIIPNADLVSGQVTNWTRGNLVGRLIIPIGVAYGSDVEKVREVLLAAADAHPMVIADPAPQALLTVFGASSLDFELRVILRDVNWKMIATDEINRDIDRRFRAEGIEIPFPQQDIWLRNAEALRPTPPDNKQVPPAGNADDVHRPDTACAASAMMDASDLHETGDDIGDGDADGDPQ